jgi:arylsulfatase A-like enzyme
MTSSAHGSERPREAQGYNVVLIVFDTLRKDALGCYEQTPDWDADVPAIHTPHLDAFAVESVRFTRAYPESLPTLCARRALYTGQRTFPFHNGDVHPKGDFSAAPGWGPIPEDQHTLAEILGDAGFRTGLISDLYHEFKPSKNFWRGFDQWTFIRGQETDPARSGPVPHEEDLDYWVPRELRELRRSADLEKGIRRGGANWFSSTILRNMHDRVREEHWTNAQVMQHAARWLEENRDARDRGERVFLTVECFDPHEPWFVPRHYRERYDPSTGRDQVISPYAEVPDLSPELLRRSRANYAGLVTMVDRWFGHLMEALRAGRWLEDTVVIVTSDHGHSLAERRYIGKRGYPSEPEVIDTPLLVRHPDRVRAGTTCDAWVQHHDIAATILDAAHVPPPEPIDGQSFWGCLTNGAPGTRDHVVVGWGSAMTVIDQRWWLNCKVDGQGALLHDRTAEGDSHAINLAEQKTDIVRELAALGMAEANRKGGIPDYLFDDAARVKDAPGCSPFAAIPLRHP